MYKRQVDNCSTDGSWKQLKALRDLDKVHVLRTEENGGYGSGNQAGIDYAVTYLEAGYVIIANPDIHVRACCIERVKLALDGMPEAVMASARVTSPEGGDLFSYWTLLPMWKDLLDTGLITRRLDVYKRQVYKERPGRVSHAGGGLYLRDPDS